MRALSREEVRRLDRRAIEEYGIPSLVLMENAGRGAAQWLLGRMGAGSRVLIVAGPGNNGGDGGVVARHLELEGVEVVIRWIAEPGQLSADAAVQYRILERAGVDQAAWPDGGGAGQLGAVLEGVEWVVDGLLGTGLSREVGGPLRGVIEALNGSGKPVVALDVPSGLDADCGLPLGVAVRAAATVSFVAPKLGFGRPGAADYTGPVVVVPIGVPRRLLREFDPAV